MTQGGHCAARRSASFRVLAQIATVPCPGFWGDNEATRLRNCCRLTGRVAATSRRPLRRHRQATRFGLGVKCSADICAADHKIVFAPIATFIVIFPCRLSQL
jgi:hypothetical protein